MVRKKTLDKTSDQRSLTSEEIKDSRQKLKISKKIQCEPQMLYLSPKSYLYQKFESLTN